MQSRMSRVVMRMVTATAVLLCLISVVPAQQDPDPNSPTPVLISQANSTEALAVSDGTLKGLDLSAVQTRAFQPGATIKLFVKNITPLPGEGATAFRIDVEDADGHRYRFPVLSIEPYRGFPFLKNTYAVTVVLTDQIGFWPQPAPTGDLLVGITWRGLISNRVRLGFGQTGGRIVDDPGAIPTPITADYSRKAASSVRPDSPDYVGYRWSGDRMRFLEQAAFGPTAAMDARLRRIGPRTWLAEQFDAPYPSTAFPYPNFPLRANNQDDVVVGCGMFLPNTNPDYQICVRDHYGMYQPQKWLFREALYGDSQLRHRVAWALSQIWVTAGPEVQQGRHMIEYHKILSGNAFGNYRTLMKQMTLNPAMGGYLDMAISTRNNPNENYARELMQLFTIGLFQLNQDGTLKVDGSNNPIPTYDQDGVNNLTKVLTGWSFCAGATCPNAVAGTVDYIDPMRINNTNNHDLTAKTLLSWPADPAFPPNNTTIPACTNCTNAAAITAYADASMDQALDNIFHHPNLGPFVALRLIQHMVTSDPTPYYVGQIAAVFNDNGFGVRGDMRAVVKAILLHPEARGDAKTDPNYGKLREPVQLATNFLRAFNVRSANGLTQSDGVIFQRGEFIGMGQVPFRSPTVFNFYPPDYGIPGTTLLGPEFALMTTNTSIQRQNYVNRMVYTNPPIAGGTVNTPDGTSLDFSDVQALAAADPTGNLLLNELNNRLMHGTMSAAMRSRILTAVTSIVSTNSLARAQQAVHLVITSSQYQVQR